MPRFIPILVIVFLAFFEAGAISILPFPFNLLSPTALFLIIRASNVARPFPWLEAVFGGLILDSVSIFPRGTYVIVLVALAALIHFLAYRFFTHRSILSLFALVALGTAGMFCALALIRWFSFLITKDSLLSLWGTQAISVILVGAVVNIILFGLVMLIRRRIYAATI